MRSLLVSDLHLTDRPNDAYRWALFDQLTRIAGEKGVTELLILGDVCEFKDYHSSRLVNMVVDNLYWLKRKTKIAEVHILKGNHDGLDPACPYFRFLNRIPWCHFYVEPTWLQAGKDTLLFLPHTRQPEVDWEKVELGNASHIFIHGTVSGAVSETGHKLEGLPLDMFRGLRSRILAGDIHVPQKVGGIVEYVGAPYPIRFGDTFEPRALLLLDDKEVSVPLDSIRKLTVKVTANSIDESLKQIRKGDQVRLLIELSASELGEFHEIKKQVGQCIEALGAQLLKVQLVKRATKPTMLRKPKGGAAVTFTPLEELEVYCNKHTVDEALRTLGKELLEENT